MTGILTLFGLALNLLLVGVMLLGWREPPPQISLPGFAACDLPCWGGITPGETRYGDAGHRLAANLPSSTLRFQPFMSEVPFQELADADGVFGAIYDSRGIVSGVRLDYPLPVWYLLETLDSPQCVHRGVQGAAMSLFSVYWEIDEVYILAALLMENPAENWRFDRETNSVFIFTGPDPCAAPGSLPWRGFGAVNK